MDSDAKVAIEAMDNSRVKLKISQNDSSLSFEFESKESSYVAALILNAARDSYEQSGKPLHDFTKNRAEWVVLEASALGLGPSQSASHESLLIQFGDAVLSLPIEKSQLRRLGETMVALSADSQIPH